MKTKCDFFIIGAPKCGTTTIASWLGQNSSIFMSNPKEPHTFATELVQRMPLQAYETMFKEQSEYIIRGEASTWYLWSSSAVDNIIKYNKNAKFIICIRNPVDMFFSYHNHAYFGGNETIENPEEAWQAQWDRMIGKRLSPFQKNPAKLLYKETCSIGTQIERLLSKVNREQCHFLSLDQIKTRPEETIFAIYDFLQLEKPSQAIDFDPKNQAKTHKHPKLFWIRQWAMFFRQRSQSELIRKVAYKVEAKTEKKALETIAGYKTTRDPMFSKNLQEEFKTEIQKVKKLTGIDLT